MSESQVADIFVVAAQLAVAATQQFIVDGHIDRAHMIDIWSRAPTHASCDDDAPCEDDPQSLSKHPVDGHELFKHVTQETRDGVVIKSWEEEIHTRMLDCADNTKPHSTMFGVRGMELVGAYRPVNACKSRPIWLVVFSFSEGGEVIQIYELLFTS